MAPKHHPTPLSGGDRKALAKELGRARTMTTILAAQSAEARAKGEALIRTADKLLCESWNEKMWTDGDAREAVKTLLVANGFLEAQLDEVRSKVSTGYARDAYQRPANGRMRQIV